MPDVKDLGNLSVFGVEPETYKDLLEIAKKQGKSVVDVASEAIKSHIDKNRPIEESQKRRVLLEG